MYLLPRSLSLVLELLVVALLLVNNNRAPRRHHFVETLLQLQLQLQPVFAVVFRATGINSNKLIER
jgi:hypothetical protein